ncbi:MAG: undecaprenyl-diphosphate phosphatase, partial [Acidimicrobiia bacterium]
MLEAIVWGVIQGITEFLPISSDGHLVLVPAFLKIEPPDLATSALLHLGTLLAVIAYFRQDLVALGRSRSNPNARRLLILLVIGSVPAAAALLVVDLVSDLQQSVSATASFLIITGLVMALVGRLPRGRRTIDDMQPADALLIGVAQLLAVLPGISRSGFTIATGLGQRIDKLEAARFS